MAAQLTIGGTPVTMIEDQHDLTNALDERQRFKCDVIDYSGTLHFVKGEQVVLTDPVLGVIYSGYLNSDKEVPQYPSGAILHSIDCIDQRYLADKRTYTRTYSTPANAGKIVVDHLNDVLLAEGVAQNFALDYDTTQTDWGQGILSGTAATLNVGDGDLELSTAGSAVTITESTTANFSTGTLTNVAASNNILSPTTQSAIFLQSDCVLTQTAAQLYVKIWSGSVTIGTNDTFNFTLWISGTSPQQMAFVDFICSDGTYLSTTTGLADQNNVSATPTTDLTNYATNQWYTRQIAITALHGKTINTILVGFSGAAAGTYAAYFKNIFLSSASGSPFFSTTATATQVTPPPVFQNQGYATNQTTVSVVQTFDPANSYRVSSSYSIGAVSLLRSSLVTYNTVQPGKSLFTLLASYDGGTSYLPCPNNSALPALPSGSNVSGLTSVVLKEVFGSSDTTPTTIPSLANVSIQVLSAPNPTSPKSDVVTTYATSANWNAGTHSFTTVSGNSLIPGTYTRNWNDGLITNQTFFPLSGATQSASSLAYAITNPVDTSGLTQDSQSRFDFAGISSDFTLECDMKVSSGNNVFAQMIYRTTAWFAGITNNYGYIIGIGSAPNYIALVKGTNSSTSSGTTIVSTTSVTVNTNTFYHLKIVVNGAHHQIYFNNSTTPLFDVIDTTFVGPGNTGFMALTGDSSVSTTCTIDNFALTPAYTSTWTSTSTSISSLGTCGPSVIQWIEVNTTQQSTGSVQVQTSVDGGSTFQTCTNGGAIPNLPSGTNVSGKSVQVKITFTAISQALLPSVTNLTWRVLGAYPGSSGTRSTAPLGNDTMVRANQSGWGTSFDGQIWAKTGTGTDAINSNEATITNTTGDVHEVCGSRTGTDEDGTVRFQLSASTIQAGMELRYTDTNNFYRCSTSTTTLTLFKIIGGSSMVLGTASISLTVSTFYRMRFRVTGTNPVTLMGRVWADSTLEPTTWNLTVID